MSFNELLKSSKEFVKEDKRSNFGYIVVGLTGGTAVLLSVLCYPFVSPALRRICLPYVPATDQQVYNVFQALKGKSGKLLDIGSGDGRIVIAAARHGFDSHGVELNYWLVLYSRFNAFIKGFSKKTNFHCKDLWKFQLNSFNNIVIFGVEEMMDELNVKFTKELSDTYVVACRFPIPGRTCLKTVGTGIDAVWLYHFSKVN